MNDPEKKLPKRPEHEPSGQPTLRATRVLCEVDGGAFLLQPVAPYEENDRFAEGRSAFVEVGRFVISPVAFQVLKQQIASAEEYYKKYFGTLPDIEALAKRWYADTPEQRVEAAQRMGFRIADEPPKTA